jgi:hypothetical protein
VTGRTVLVYAPLLALGLGAGALNAVARRSPDPRRRRACDIAWILALLVGAPVWLFVAAALHLL